MGKQKILSPGRNCWRMENAERVAFLIDGADYFRAIYATISRAKHSIFVLSWDIDSQFRLLRGECPDQLPVRFGDLMNAIVSRNKHLHAYILDWDFAMLYAMDREWLPIYKLQWKTHRRLNFVLDNKHPVGASHHQKVVVIDDSIAFSGGLDITKGRWDTPEHRADDPRRLEGEESHRRPYHDVQMAVSGAAAAALGELARERWRRATRHSIPGPESGMAAATWPDDLRVDIENVEIAIIRTEPEYNGRSEVREVEQLFLDAIAAARHAIYIENQYLTANSIGKALTKRLMQADGPEVVMVLPLKTDGWLTQNTMDMLRVRLLKQLRAADHHNRLRVYFPVIPGQDNYPINVHAKIMVVDNRLLVVGSANLNNRSMGLDTECDLALESNDEQRVEQAICDFRDRLLAEHLDVPPQKVAAAVAQHHSLIKGIESLRSDGRTLQELEPQLPELVDNALTDDQLVDPERSVSPDWLIEQFISKEERKPAARRVELWLILLVFLLLLAAAWRWTPLNEWLSLIAVRQFAAYLEQLPATPLWVIGTFAIAVLLMIPVTVLIVATILIFGPWSGFTYALAGALTAAVAGYGAGSILGRNMVRKLGGSAINRISRQLAKRGLLAVIIVRVVPVAPFAIINLVAGASHITFRSFVIGTLIGMAPGMIAITVLADRVAASLQSPHDDAILTMAITVSAIAAAAYMLVKWLRSKVKNGKRSAPDKP